MVLVLISDESEARRIEAVRRDFVANVSHELKTPIGALGLLSEAILGAKDQPDAVVKFASRMQNEAKRLTELVQEIIDLSRLQSSDPLQKALAVEVSDVVREAVDQAQFSSEQRGISLEIDAYDRSYILYNIGLIHTSNGEHGRALEYYYQALERNPSLPSALNNIAVIYHYRGEQAIENGQSEISSILFEKAADYWKEAIRLAPTNYIEAQNWLKMTGRNKGVESLNV